jgi:hypothetical protein
MQFSLVAAMPAQKGTSSGRSASSARSPVAHRREPVEAQVVPPALHAGGGERHAEGLAQERDVLEVDLLLQVLGAGGHDHAMAAQDGRGEIGQGLARAGARFGEEDAAPPEHPGDGRGHVALPGSGLELRNGPRQRAVVGEDPLDERVQTRRLPGLVRRRDGARRRPFGFAQGRQPV